MANKPVVGTMTTTLLPAYSTSHITIFLLFMAEGLPAANILNAPFMAAEVLNIPVGSFGLVTVAPFTALLAGLIHRERPEKKAARTQPRQTVTPLKHAKSPALRRSVSE